MAASLHARGIALAIGAHPVLVDADLRVDPGHRVGLVGPNGVGKSTLLRVLAGELVADEGRVIRVPPAANVGYLAQEPQRTSETVGEHLARRTGTAAAQGDLDRATTALAAGEPHADDRYSIALDRWMALGSVDLAARAATVLSDLGIALDLDGQPMASLSGGEAARIGLASLLLSRFDIVLLDEPTNDLDLDGLDRLERFVGLLAVGTVVVSHDRTFLERIVTDVVELDEFTRTTTHFAGGWDAYLRERATARALAVERYDVYEDKRSGLASRAQREREWASQGLSRAKKRPDDNDKNIRAFKIDQTEQLAGRAARTERAVERLEVVDKPREPWKLRFQVAAAERSGDVVARLEEALVRRGSFTLGPIDLEVRFGERVLLAGANGAGKSTLLAAMLGDAELDEGRVWRGPSVVVGRLEQARAQLDGAGTTLDRFLAATGMAVSDARTLLAKFGIGADHVVRGVASLSPGERTRMVLALLMAAGSNCVVLDEPTNHLDLPAIEQLEAALASFAGTLIMVSHDRSLLANVAVTRRIDLAGGQIVADATL